LARFLPPPHPASSTSAAKMTSSRTTFKKPFSFRPDSLPVS
jgi:hypothetical protein